MIRILHVLNSFSSGGVETFIMNMYRNINRSKVQFDFMLRSTKNQEKILHEINELGGNVYIMPEFPQQFLSNYKEVKQFMIKHSEYQIIHVHANSLIYIFPLILGKKYGIEHRIIHSHNTKANKDSYKYIHFFHRQLLKLYATEYVACGVEAANWMFKNNSCTYLYNAVDCNALDFSTTIRKKMRHSLNLENKKVIAHIGRFVPAKNHEFLIRIMKKLIKIDEAYVLLLIGEGELFGNIENLIHANNLQNNIKLLGKRDDISNLLQAIDIVVMPSLHEGLPFALIEAQASGTPVIASDKIDSEVQITDLMLFLSLEDSIMSWCEAIINTDLNKKSYKEEMLDKKYDIHENAKFLEEFYRKICLK